MSHVDDGQLHAWLDGELAATGGDEAAFEAHLENCALCLGRLERARAEREEADRILAFVAPPGIETPPFADLVRARDAGVGERRGGSGSSSVGSGRGRVALGWAATVVLALGGGWMARGAVMAPGPGEGPGGTGGVGSARSQVVALAEAGADADESVGAGAGATPASPLPAPATAAPPAALVAPLPEPVRMRVAEQAWQGQPQEDGARADQARVEEAVAEPGVAVRITPAGVRIENNRADRVIYLVLDADYAARARWVPCSSADCEGVEPGDATEVSRAGVPGWQGSPSVIVFWWHLVPTPDGGVAPDSIRSIPLRYTPGPG